MLDRLEGTDGPPELFPLPHVLDGPLQRPVGGAHRLRGEYGGGTPAEAGQRAERVGAVPQRLGRHVPQLHPGLRPRLVQRGLPCPYEPVGALPYEEQRGPRPGEASGVRGHHQEARTVPVEHMGRLPVESPAAVGPPGLHPAGAPPARPVPVVVADQPEGGGEPGTRHRQGRGQFAARDPGQQRGALVLGAQGQDQRGGQDGRGDQRRGGQGPPRLLAGEGEFGDRAADSAVPLGKGEPRQTELPGERVPQAGVVSGGGPHGRPHLVRAAPLEQEFPEGAADLVLFGGETGVHGQAPPDLTGRHVRPHGERCTETERDGTHTGRMPGGRGTKKEHPPPHPLPDVPSDS